MTVEQALTKAIAVIDVKLAERHRDLAHDMFLDGLPPADIAAVMERQRAVDEGWRRQVIQKITAAVAKP